MAIIYSYPLTTPKVKDLLIGTSVFDEDDDNSPRNNPTVSFTIKSLLDMIGTGGFQTLQQVTNLGASTTNAITIANGLSVTGTFTDSTGGVGTAGQVLSSTNIGTAWVSDGGGTVKSVAATHAGNAFSASIGNVATVNPSVDITMNGITAQYVNGAGNLATLLDIPGLVTSLTTTGTSGDAATLSVGVLNIPTPVIPFTSLTTTGSGVATLTTGVLNIPDGSSVYQTTNITVSAAQLSALNGSPITLLPAPGVGKTYHFNQAFFWFEAGSVAYNFGGMGVGSAGFISVTGLFGSASSGLSDMDSASSSMVNQGRNFNYMNIDPATANAAVILTPFQGTNPNPTQGNGILYISISYEIKDLGPTIQAN